MKISHCPTCKQRLKKDHDEDDNAEGSNYHEFVGHNYICPAGHSFAIIAERPY